MLTLDTRGFTTVADLYGSVTEHALLTATQILHAVVTGVMDFFLADAFAVTILMGFTSIVQGTLPTKQFNRLLTALHTQDANVRVLHARQSWLGALLSSPCFEEVIDMLPAFVCPYTTFTFEVKHDICKSSPPPPCEHENVFRRFETSPPRSPSPPPRYEAPPPPPPPPRYSKAPLSELQKALITIGLSPDFDLKNTAEIKRMWKQTVLRTHPDKGGNSEAQQRVNDAKCVLEKHGVFTSRFS